MIFFFCFCSSNPLNYNTVSPLQAPKNIRANHSEPCDANLQKDILIQSQLKQNKRSKWCGIIVVFIVKAVTQQARCSKCRLLHDLIAKSCT